MASREEKKREAREAREAASAADADAARRQRLIALLGGAALLAIIVVVVLVAVSQGGSEDNSDAEGSAVVEEVSERGIELGDPDAPVTIVEFADPQCPYCAEFSTEVLPDIVEEYVATGDVRMELNLLTFIGEDSLRLANSAYAASEQDGMWAFMDLAFARQGAEGSGYADDAFIESLATDAGLDAGPIVDAASAPGVEVDGLVQTAKADAARNGIESTPSFLIGPTDGELEPFAPEALELEAFSGQIDEEISAAQGG